MSDQTIDRSKLPIRRPVFSGVANETLDGSQHTVAGQGDEYER